jgi:hypothetical protein
LQLAYGRGKRIKTKRIPRNFVCKIKHYWTQQFRRDVNFTGINEEGFWKINLRGTLILFLESNTEDT